MPMSRPILLMIVASTRPGRVGRSVADWFEDAAREHGAFEVEVADLKELDLPFLDEPNHPRLQKYTHDHTKRWSAIVERAHAVVFVMPEYNYGFNAPVKNALDYLFHEWRHKPVSFVSYGGVSGGLRATQMFKQVVTTVGMHPTQAAVTIPVVAESMGDGRFTPDDVVAESAAPMLDELASLSEALRPLRG